ncbi:pyridoxal phosphate-dependent aminotransferase [Burkholderia thailandensis]|uniref:Cys/Met metabolism PLP-dependent enzyme family protein n=1 Tax=Burkholderia thailandensis TaxID=57975 RepID=A0AAW9D443_BURTH|nr:pyridoxal phosphate-dependent aminotransferase [Burkholderia thailandensis]MCS3390490.1 pyridoxal phosphate-dependent aminotransferase [Burkholderia thailandensis]MCS6424376.1 pyridoxal phosphate-dependent aminotransferase [Burkholderia thailandensis]MCS6451603.1 pyridoxal phosphate-dependent aminotransferase [Burkholderia thailandensis]MCS6463690.1 pyridoxal phosphate-dependent aminotransferase [Burkholderia thailandensis]MCS6481762.1 pyridoxal phosphate-dependent aminotransferase [Burkhol
MQSAAAPRSKLPDVGTTIFSVIGQLAAEHQALNLSQGAPSFAPDPALVERAARAMRDGHNQYAPMAGVAALRDALAVKTERLYGGRYDPDSEVTVVASASEGLYAAISALVHPGDEVIYFEPSFDSYAPIVRLQGATPVAIKLSPDGFRVNWDEVAAKITPRTRMLIVNTPHNPSATILGDADIAHLARLTAGTDIVVLSDEVYEHVVFDGARHHSMARHRALAERSVIVSSFGKSYHVTGWRVGYCLAPAELTRELRKVHQFMTFAADTPMQHAFAEALAEPASYLELGAFYERKRNLLASELAGSRFELQRSEGSFFMLARFRHFSDESDADFVLRAIRDARVATIPLSAFYADGTNTGCIRLSFSKDDATLIEGARRLRSL